MGVMSVEKQLYSYMLIRPYRSELFVFGEFVTEYPAICPNENPKKLQHICEFQA